jgi:bifunctional non-homologous end joining protein LigD
MSLEPFVGELGGMADKLTKYRAKRDFTKTTEPKGRPAACQGNGYLIQKHAASHLHYDLRLELDGALKSWAVPKGPSPDPKDRRLAMAVEDHPVAYGSFEGIIPRGEYGGGTVMLWDQGTWEPVGDAKQGLAKGKLVFKVYGQRMKGEWTLVKTRSRDKRDNSWLLIKHHDEEERPGDNGALVNDNQTSVLSGRTMDEIAADGNKVWKSNRVQSADVEKPTPAPKLSPKPRRGVSAEGKTAKMPGFTPPQLATLSTSAPKGAEWVHEVKFDGYRMVSYIDHGDVTIYSRNGNDWTDRFRMIAGRLAAFSVDSAVMDGELVVTDGHGRSDFSQLKDALSKGETNRLQYYLFDLLYLNGHSLVELPLRERKNALQELLTKNRPANNSHNIFFSTDFTEDADYFLRNVCSMQLEGIVSKRVDAPYHQGRSKTWLKTKCQKRQEFVVGGFTLPSNGGRGVGALLLGFYDGEKLVYSGRVGTGFTVDSSRNIRKILDKLVQTDDPYSNMTVEARRGAIWVRPQLVAEVEFTEWTPDGRLRHPSFKGLREDKPARSVVKEIPVSPGAIKKAIAQEAPVSPGNSHKPMAKTPATSKAKAASTSPILYKDHATVAGIRISHPDRVIYPDSDITKLKLAEYYFSVADHILPHVINRSLSTVRCPEGAAEPCFFQRHVGLGKSPDLHEVRVQVKDEARNYLMIQDLRGLISLVQWGVIELHPWQCSVKDLTKPDRMVFDLDPDPSAAWKQLMEGAYEVKQRLEQFGLKTFLKTTGGKGLHIVIPLTPAYSFDTIKSFAKAIADSMVSDNPSHYVAKSSKEARKGRIFVDYLRNDVTSTAVAAFSARARPGATVSTPLNWTELNASLKLNTFTVETVPERLARQKDPWADFFKVRQKIDSKYLKALKVEF